MFDIIFRFILALNFNFFPTLIPTSILDCIFTRFGPPNGSPNRPFLNICALVELPRASKGHEILTFSCKWPFWKPHWLMLVILWLFLVTLLPLWVRYHNIFDQFWLQSIYLKGLGRGGGRNNASHNSPWNQINWAPHLLTGTVRNLFCNLDNASID